MPTKLCKDVRLTDIFGAPQSKRERRDQETILRHTVGEMSRCKMSGHETVSVRIGFQGQGSMPSRRIEFVGPTGKTKVYSAYHGIAGNRPLENFHEGNWSTLTNTYAEIRALLGGLPS